MTIEQQRTQTPLSAFSLQRLVPVPLFGMREKRDFATRNQDGKAFEWITRMNTSQDADWGHNTN